MVFRHTVTGAGLARKHGVMERVGCAGQLLVIDVCGCLVGANKIFQIPADGVRGRFKFFGYSAAADKKFQPAQDSNVADIRLSISYYQVNFSSKSVYNLPENKISSI